SPESAYARRTSRTPRPPPVPATDSAERHPTARQFPNGQICMTMFNIRGMHRILASSIGVTCAAALAVPLAPATAIASASPTRTPHTTQTQSQTPTTETTPEGRTESLPLKPLTSTRATATPTAPEQGLRAQDV